MISRGAILGGVVAALLSGAMPSTGGAQQSSKPRVVAVSDGATAAGVAALGDAYELVGQEAPDVDQVLIASGAVELARTGDANEVMALIESVIGAHTGASCVQVATVHEVANDPFYQLGAHVLNESIRALPIFYPNVRIVDWAQVEGIDHRADSPHGPVARGLQLTELGATYFAQTARAGLDACHAGASVTTVVYSDDNGNGQRDEGEAGVDGVVISLVPDPGRPPAYEPTHELQLTAGGGRTSRTNLPAGDYIVAAEGQQWAFYGSAVYTSPASSSVTLQPGQEVTIEIGYRATGPRVAVLGDSILSGADSELRQALPGHQVSVAARPARRVAELQWWADRYAELEPDQVVIDLGTNDVLQHWDLERSVGDLDRMVGAFPDAACVHVTTVSALDPRWEHDASVINHYIRLLPETFPNVHIVDWDQFIRGISANRAAREALLPDAIHPSGAGNQFLVAAIAQNVGWCDLLPR